MDPLTNLPDHEFVDFCYQFFLGRNADPGGLSSCLTALGNGTPRIELIRSITSSDEHFRLMQNRELCKSAPTTTTAQNWTRYRVDEVVDVDPVTSAVRSYIEQSDVRAYLHMVAERIEIRNACEVGCGFGRMTQVLSEFAASVRGFEREPSFIDLAAQLMPHIRFTQTDYPGALPACDGEFDFALTFTFLQHLTDATATSSIVEIKRIVRPGGYMLCCEETDTDHRHGETDNPKGKCTIGRSVQTYAELFHPFTLERTSPRRIEPTYSRPNVGTYMLFRAPNESSNVPSIG